MLHGIRFFWGVISIFHLILVTLNDFAKFKLFVPISSVLHLERKEKKYLWIYLDV